MSKTTRKNKWGETVRDGQRYKCRCSWCMGETKRKNEAEVLNREIKETVGLFYGWYDWDKEGSLLDKSFGAYPTQEEEKAWIEYQEAT